MIRPLTVKERLKIAEMAIDITRGRTFEGGILDKKVVATFEAMYDSIEAKVHPCPPVGSAGGPSGQA